MREWMYAFPGQSWCVNLRPTYFGGLYVVVEVVSEGLNVRYALLPPLLGEVSREQDWLDVNI